MIINTGQIAPLLRPGLAAIIGQYADYPEQWTEIYKTYNSHKFQEIEVEMKYTGAAVVTAEGSPIQMGSMGQRVTTTYIHKKVALGFVITKEAIEDDLYTTQFPQQALSLRKSLRYTKNVLGANVLNNAFNAAHPTGDGQPVCSDSHPIDGGVFSNVLGAAVAVDLSEAGMEQAIIQIQSFPMQSGIPSQTMAKKLIVPRELQFAAERLLGSEFRTDTANNDINALVSKSYIPQGWRVNQFLTSPSAWFLLTDAEDGFKHYQRTPVETDTYADFNNESVSAKATERYSFGISNVRGVLGSPGI